MVKWHNFWNICYRCSNSCYSAKKKKNSIAVKLVFKTDYLLNTPNTCIFNIPTQNYFSVGETEIRCPTSRFSIYTGLAVVRTLVFLYYNFGLSPENLNYFDPISNPIPSAPISLSSNSDQRLFHAQTKPSQIYKILSLSLSHKS